MRRRKLFAERSPCRWYFANTRSHTFFLRMITYTWHPSSHKLEPRHLCRQYTHRCSQRNAHALSSRAMSGRVCPPSRLHSLLAPRRSRLPSLLAPKSHLTHPRSMQGLVRTGHGVAGAITAAGAVFFAASLLAFAQDRPTAEESFALAAAGKGEGQSTQMLKIFRVQVCKAKYASLI